MTSAHYGAVDYRRLSRRDDAETSSTCSGYGSTLDNMSLRIASIFIILVGSLLGAFLPMLLARTPTHWRFSKVAFFVCKYFGSGVILGTSFMHLLSPAVAALSDDCLSDYLPDYDWGHAICLMTIMAMFFIELMAARFNFGFGHSHGPESPALPKSRIASDGLSSDGSSSELPPPAMADTNGNKDATAMTKDVENDAAKAELGASHQHASTGVLHTNGLPNTISYPPAGEDHLAHGRDHIEGDHHGSYGSQILSLLILEFGIVFHSLFIGLSLAGSDNLKILLIVIAFHQFFEGLGLGTRLAVAKWPSNWKNWTGILMGIGYGFTTPIGIAIGLGVNKSLSSNPAKAQLANGLFDAVSSGILVYTALVELLAHEFMFNPEMRDAKIDVQLLAYCCVAGGVAIMAVLAKWV